MNPDQERARCFGVEGDDEGPDLPGHDESRTLAYGLARASLSMLPGGELLATLVDHEQRRQVRHARDLVDRVADEVGPEALLSRVTESEGVSAVFRQAVDAAARTGDALKRRALARIVAAAVLDDAKVDEAAIYALALRDLDAPHLRLLEAMRRATEDASQRLSRVARDPASLGGRKWEDVDRATTTSEIRQQTLDFPGSVVVGLSRVGCLQPRGTHEGKGPTRPEDFRISGFGHGLLQYVRGADPESADSSS